MKNGTVALSGNVILSHFFFRMVDKEKIGIVGRNGAGKTTILKLMTGEIGLDYNDDNTMGEIVKSKDYNVGYLKQKLAGSDDEANLFIREPLKRSILKNLFFENATNLGVGAGTIPRKSQNTDFFEVPINDFKKE